MAKRPRFSRWRRLPPVFRTGEHRPIGTGNELDRIILYLPARSLDLAEALAEKAGIPAIQDYCGQLLNQAVGVREGPAKSHRIRSPARAAGGLEGNRRRPITWRSGSWESDAGPASLPSPSVDAISVNFVLADQAEEQAHAEGSPPQDTRRSPGSRTPGSTGRPHGTASPSLPPSRNRSRSRRRPGRWSALAADRAAMEVLWRHLGFDGSAGFLPCLRRGVPVPAAGSAELVRALHQLEADHRGAEVLDRRLAHALHRLASSRRSC